MPNPKTGTVTMDVAKAVTEVKAGKIDFKVDKTGIVHAPIGKASFSADKISRECSRIIINNNEVKTNVRKRYLCKKYLHV